MSPSLVPNIFVCPHPSYDVNLLSSNGYLTPFWWYSGFDKQFKFIGWNGDQGSFTNNISESVATLKKSSLIPSIQLQIMMKDKIINRYAKLAITSHVFPYGSCFRIIKPELNGPDEKITGLLLIQEMNQKITKGFTKFTVYFRDSSCPDLGRVRMEGETITAEMSNHGMKRYDTHLEMSIHIEDDPRQDCKKDITEHAHEICL